MRLKQSLILFMLVVLLALIGCDTDLARTKQERDQQVYGLIDQVWTDDLGAKSNYHIQDAFSDGNDVLVAGFVPEGNVLTLAEALQIATENNRQYSTEKENLYLTALDFTDIRHLYEPMPIFGGDGGYRQDDDVEAVGGFSRFGFTQLLATGAQVGADISLGWLDITAGGLSSGLSGGFSSVASAVISQPLLRGSQRDIVLENLTQAERNMLYQVRFFNRFRKAFVTQIATDYQRTLELYEQWQNLNEYYFQLSSLCYALKKRTAVGRNSIHEYEEAEQDRLIALADATIAERLYAEALDVFKVQLSIRPDVNLTLDVSELRKYQQVDPVDFTLSEEAAIEMALNQRLDLANAADQVNDAERKVDVAADAIRAELNLIGYTELQQPDRTVFGANPGELEATRNRYQLSVQLDLPIDRLFEKNNYRRALIDLMLVQRNHQELTDTVIREVRESYRGMKEAYRRYMIEQDGLRLAQERTLHTLSLAEYRRASVRDVLDAQEDLVDAKNAVTLAIVDYFEASMNFLRDTGTLKVREDGTWHNPDSFLVQDN